MHARSLLLFALCVAAPAARAERLWLQSDVDKCAQRAADRSDPDLQGKVRFHLLVRKDGQVYAAFVHNEQGVKSRTFEGCVANAATLIQIPGRGVDFTWPFQLSLVPGGIDNGGMSNAMGAYMRQTPPSVFLPASNEVLEPAELDVQVAQATLEVRDDASAAERGTALLAVHKHPEAIAQFRTALGKDGNDPVALRGLAAALAESGGDLKEARTVAERLAAVAPGSVVGPETMLRVCAAAKDDECVFQSFKAARAAKDVQSRARDLLVLQPVAQAAAERLRAAAKSGAGQPPQAQGAGQGAAAVATPGAPSSAAPGVPPPAAAMAPTDACAKEQGDEKQALCEVKRCLDEGSVAYAKELSQQNGVDYVVGEWRAKPVGSGGGKLLVTRPIESKQAGAARHDAIWLVKLGEQFSISPSTAEARQITLGHNACSAQTRR